MGEHEKRTSRPRDKGEREARLARELRANLKKRKARARGEVRRAPPEEPGEDAAGGR